MDSGVSSRWWTSWARFVIAAGNRCRRAIPDGCSHRLPNSPGDFPAGLSRGSLPIWVTFGIHIG